MSPKCERATATGRRAEEDLWEAPLLFPTVIIVWLARTCRRVKQATHFHLCFRPGRSHNSGLHIVPPNRQAVHVFAKSALAKQSRSHSMCRRFPNGGNSPHKILTMSMDKHMQTPGWPRTPHPAHPPSQATVGQHCRWPSPAMYGESNTHMPCNTMMEWRGL
jgi:hypothetical protein